MYCTEALTVHHNLREENNGKIRKAGLIQWVTFGSHQCYFSSYSSPGARRGSLAVFPICSTCESSRKGSACPISTSVAVIIYSYKKMTFGR